jgi:DNA polymerase/3'-5' exonuclease PolX
MLVPRAILPDGAKGNSGMEQAGHRPKFQMTQEGKSKVARSAALEVAKELCALLKPATDRLVVAGSLRRGEIVVGDIEILFIEKFEDRKVDMFVSEGFNVTQEKIAAMVKYGTLSKRLNKLGNVSAWGPENKLAVHCASGIAVDLFSATAENWWMSLVIRTGPKELNLRLAVGAKKLGRRLHANGPGVSENGHMTICKSEEDVFALCGIPYLVPKDR